MEIKYKEENFFTDFNILSIYLDKVLEALNKNIIDYQSK